MGEDAVIIAVAWTHLREWGKEVCDKKREVWTVSKRAEPLQLQLLPEFKLS